MASFLIYGPSYLPVGSDTEVEMVSLQILSLTREILERVGEVR